MIILDKQILTRGAAFIYIQVVTSAISAYVFWLIMTQLTTSFVIGTLSTLVAIVEILTSFAGIGIPNSIQRFLGRTFSEGKLNDSKIYVETSLFFTSIGLIAACLLLVVGSPIFELVEIDSTLQMILVFIVASKSIQLLLSSIVISTLKTGLLAAVNIVSSTTKIVVSIILVLIGTGIIGLAVGYLLIDSILSSVFLAMVIMKYMKPISKEMIVPRVNFFSASRDILTGGLTNWIPLLVTSIGLQLGTIVLFGSKGASDAAAFFLAINIVNGILFSTTAIFAIALPALSSMSDGRKRVGWQTIRWSSLISMPLASSLVFFSQDVMKLFGENYVKGGISFEILLSSILPIILANGVANLTFSYGKYKQSLAIHLAMNLPRTVLYLTLIPDYGIIGGAVSFVVGSILALVVSIIIISKFRIIIIWKDLALMSVIPLTIGWLLNTLQFDYIQAILITIAVSYMILFKLHIVTSSDIQDLLSILPNSLSNQMLIIWRKIKH